jgi:hypothetical protein
MLWNQWLRTAVQVTLVTRASANRVFISVSWRASTAYPRANLEACVEPFPGLPGNVVQMTRLASKNSGVRLTSKWPLLYVSCFTRLRYTQRFPGTHPAYNEGHLGTQHSKSRKSYFSWSSRLLPTVRRRLLPPRQNTLGQLSLML